MECFLHCCDNTHDPIPLPDGVDVVVGRLPQLKIKSVKCSRKQVQLTADYKENEVKVKQLGKHPSTIAGHKLTQGQTSTLGPGGQICLLDNDYTHFIYFKIPQTVKSPPKSMNVDEYFENKSKNPKGVSPVKNRLKRKIEETGDDLCFDSKKIKNDGVDVRRSKSTASKDLSSEKNRKRKLQENDDKDHADSKKMKTDFNDGTRLEPSSKNLTEVENKNDGSKNLSPSENKKQNIDDTDDDSCVKSKKSKTLSNDARPESVCGDITTDECNEDDAVSVGTPCTSSTWDEIPGELMVYTRKGVEGRSKIAGFDMDGTLITTKSGKVFPRDTGDWKILLPHIPGKLKSLWSEGFKIVIFTNQNGIAKKKVTIPDFKKKIEHVVQALCVPIQVIISPGTGHYRKPSPGMWQYLCNNLNQGIKINKDKSYYIGDAAGRPVGWAPGKKKDFSCSDRAFASNVGMNFQTPEEFFLDRKPAPYEMPAFNPKKLDPNRLLLEPSTANLLSKEKEVIIMVGFPASGKSTFCEKYLVREGYVRVNRDSLGTWQKCVSSSRSALSQGKSVVVDNTNGDKVSRQRYIDCAKEAKVPVRCFIMDVDKEHAEHNNKFREALNTDNNYKKVSTMVYNTYKKAFVEPSKEEGFSEIVRVQFKPFFKNEETRKIYNQYL